MFHGKQFQGGCDALQSSFLMATIDFVHFSVFRTIAGWQRETIKGLSSCVFGAFNGLFWAYTEKGRFFVAV
jgi:hypothetical protein